jgi:hypothetical protein
MTPVIVVRMSVAVLVIVALRREVLNTGFAVVDLYGLHGSASTTEAGIIDTVPFLSIIQ